MKLDVKSPTGAGAGTVDVPDELFGIEPNAAVMHQVVTAQLAAMLLLAVYLGRRRNVLSPESARRVLDALVQMGLEKLPDIPDVPAALDLINGGEDRQVLELILLREETGRPFAAPPGVPGDRLRALRQAFADTLKDPAFIAEAAKLQLEIEPLRAREIDMLLANAFASPKAIVQQAAALIEPSAQK